MSTTSSGTPAAEIVPHGPRARWLSSEWLMEQLADRQADFQLSTDLDRLAGSTIDIDHN